MSSLISEKCAEEQRGVLTKYYDHVKGLRAAGNLERVYGRAFVYRPDGTAFADVDTQYVVWNMRLAPPVQTFNLAGNLHALLGMLAADDVPCEFPDLGDSVVIDIEVSGVLDELLMQANRDWSSPLNAKLFDSPDAMFAQGVANVCVGDIPWDICRADAVLRACEGWDVHDLPGTPWVRVEAAPHYIKTQRMQAHVRAEMAKAGIEQLPKFGGHPSHEGTTVVGVFNGN